LGERGVCRRGERQVDRAAKGCREVKGFGPAGGSSRRGGRELFNGVGRKIPGEGAEGDVKVGAFRSGLWLPEPS
jgi:hypothetical protein